MILKNFKLIFCSFILFSFSIITFSEEKIDIWKNKETINNEKDKKIFNSSDNSKKSNLNSNTKIEKVQSIKIEDGLTASTKEKKVFGIYDPSDFNFNLNMWSATKAEDVRASIKRLNKINLSKTSSEIYENIILSFSYPPDGMNDKEFVELKINWMIENKRTDLIESFLKQNQEFVGKSKAVQFLVDQNIF